MGELISIIVPVYNVEVFLSRCIESIIQQTYTNLEIILIDDGSTDGSGDICDDYAKKDKRILVIHQKNKGLVATRKKGIEVAKGAYIGFVDADDWIECDMYQYMLEKMLKYQVDMVSCNTLLEYGEAGGRSSSERVSNIIAGVYRRNAIGEKCSYNHIYSNKMGEGAMIGPAVWDKLYKKEIIRKYYLDISNDIVFGEDFACIGAAIPYIEAIYCSDKIFYHYNRYNIGSITQNLNEEAIISVVKVYMHLKGIYVMHEAKEILIGYLERYLIQCILPFMTEIIKYHFPVEEIREVKKIILYGVGAVGKSYLAQFKKNPQIEVVSIMDSNKVGLKLQDRVIEGPHEIDKKYYDMIVIAVLHQHIAEEIENELIEKYHIQKNKIIWKKPNQLLDMII